ncbi:MAG: imidazoleglycerol-phosphate dehydratase [Vampirovibrionales bacterium]|nr:imidazoleglycerol-phosphate dehydratase [Vampirovibrionales bacterium]
MTSPSAQSSARAASVSRVSRETRVQVTFEADAARAPHIQTPLPFFSHMLDAFACHGRFGLSVEASGDIEVDPHHLMEDVGIVLGQAIAQALDGYKGIARAGCFAFPMDGSLALVALDLCGRPNLTWNVPLGALPVGALDPHLFREFFKGLIDGMRATAHLHVPCHDNDHHVLEALFKAFARALRQAAGRIEPGDALSGALSTKGMLDA